jgi:hypothetical protein
VICLKLLSNFNVAPPHEILSGLPDPKEPESGEVLTKARRWRDRGRTEKLKIL